MLTLISDPVAVTAFVNGVTSWLGFPASALPKCEACGGDGQVVGGHPGSTRFHVACDACGGSGRVSLPEGRSIVLVASTCREPEGGSAEWVLYSDGISWSLCSEDDDGIYTKHAVDVSSVYGTATIEWVPIYDREQLSDDGLPIEWQSHIDVYDGGITFFEKAINAKGYDDWRTSDISDALAFSSFPVGGFAVRLINFTPSVWTTARRIQQKRTAGWRKPDGAISVSRPSRWGNPFKVSSCIEAGFADTPDHARRVCVDAFRDWLNGDSWAAGNTSDWAERRSDILDHLGELRGRDLMCFCAEGVPCHGDVLLAMANAPIACPLSFDAPVEPCVLDLDVTDLTA